MGTMNFSVSDGFKVLSLLLLGLSACATVPSDLPLEISGQLTDSEQIAPPAYPFTAQGQEPPWRIEVSDRSLTLTTAYGSETRMLTLLDVEQLGERTVFRAADHAGAVRVTADRRVCRDSMSGMPHPYSVALSGVTGIQPGCGGRPIDLLAGKEWIIHSLDGSAPLAGSRVTLRFMQEDGRVAGSGSCNRYQAGYTLDGESLRFSDAASTKMGCAPEVMRQEQNYHEILNGIDRFDIDDNGDLILFGRNGRTLIGIRAYPLTPQSHSSPDSSAYPHQYP